MFEQTHKHAKGLGKKGLPHEELFAQMFHRDLADRSMAYESDVYPDLLVEDLTRPDLILLMTLAQERIT